MSKRYIPIGSSAKGGIGKVIFCNDKNLDRKVAVKFTQAIGDHGRLYDELLALQQIRSKHVVEIFDVDYFAPGTQMGIVEEFIDGSPLDPLLGKVKPDEQFLRLLFQMASGLTDIHSVGFTHRDIKPANMLIDADKILKIIDFNLARPAGDAHTRGFLGTRGYAAPELYSDGEVHFSEKVDVYSLCVTAFALLRGLPLPAKLSARPPRPDEWKAETGGFGGLSLPLDAELVRLLDAGLSENPANRPSASELCQRVERVLLRGKHRGLFTNEAGQAFELSSDPTKATVTFTHPSRLGGVSIAYDGLDFRSVAVSGEVWANNIELRRNDFLPGSCVIGLGGPHRATRDRIFITMDVSHPEFVL